MSRLLAAARAEGFAASWRGTAREPGLVLAFLVLAAVPALARPKTDVVVLHNGDRVTCEIKRLNRGKLQVKTDDMGTIEIEWAEIASVTAGGLFEIEDLLGNLYYGPLDTAEGEQLEVATAEGIQTLPLLSVAGILPIEASFWEKLSGRLDLGFGYTKSSDLAEFNADGSVKYVQPNFSARLEGSSLIQRQDEGTDATRNSLSFSYTRNFEERRFALGQVSADQNRELGYELRAGVAGAWGKYFLRTQGNEAFWAAGLYLNREVPVDGETTDNLEALLAADWANFSYNFPKTDMEVGTLLVIGLTDWGRYRVDVDGRVSREVFSDFTVSVKGYYNYDSRSPTTGESQDDYQISLALGYTF
jgi:hypothetical protein